MFRSSFKWQKNIETFKTFKNIIDFENENSELILNTRYSPLLDVSENQIEFLKIL